MDDNITDLILDFQQEIDNTAKEEVNCFLSLTSSNVIKLDEYNTNTELSSIPRIFTEDEFINDFIRVRNDLLDLINGSKQLLSKIPMTLCSTKPSMITAISSLSNSVNQNGKLLIEIHEKILKMQKDAKLMSEGVNPDQPNIINNNLTINTKDLNQIIEDMINKNKNGGQ